MADITLTSAPVTWRIANLIRGAKARGANGYVEFEASTVAAFHGGLTWLPSPQRVNVVDGVMDPIDLPINDPDLWNWRVSPHLGVHWDPFHINVDEDGTDLSSAAIVPGKGPVRVLQGPKGASIVDFRDTGDGALVLILSDGTESPPVPFTRGPAGPANQIEIGTVMRGDEAYASLTGEAPSQRLNLTLPKGDPGNPEDLIDATPKQRGLMAAADKAHLDQTLTADQVVESTEQTLVKTNSVADNFMSLAPRYVTRLDARMSNTMQGFGRDSQGRLYVSQVYGPSANRDISITRLDPDGRPIDSSVLLKGGHGSGIGYEEVNGEMYCWVWWNDVGVGKKNALRRWKYRHGQTVPMGHSSAEVKQDFVSNLAGFENANFSTNQRLDLIGICVRLRIDGAGYDLFQLRRLSEYKAGVDNVIAQLPPIPVSGNGNMQAFTVTMEHAYLFRGATTSRLDQYRWSDGQRIAQKELTHVFTDSSTPNSGRVEPEAIFPAWDDAGRVALLLGVQTGNAGQNRHHVYTLAPRDFQADTGESAALQRLYAPLRWEVVPLRAGFKPRGEPGGGYELQVAKDAHGMVHLRGGMSSDGFTGAAQTFADIPPDYCPEVEVRWMGFRSGMGSTSLGGYITPGGAVTYQADNQNPEGPRPGAHFNIIIQPWPAKA